MASVQRISEAYLLPVIALLLESFPFDIRGFHSDSGSEFVNHEVLGTLSCGILVDPATARAERPALEHAIRRLRYGCVGVNVWPAIGYALGHGTWGAFPGHTPEDVGSGIGVVHNAFLFDHPQKSVVRAPFRIRPKPIWFAGHRRLDRLGFHLMRFQVRRTPGRLASIAWNGLRG